MNIKNFSLKGFKGVIKKTMRLWPRWRYRLKCFTSLHNQKKDNNQFKNKKQPEVPESQTAWKSDNEGVKETSRPVGGAKTGSRAERMHDKAVDRGVKAGAG